MRINIKGNDITPEKIAGALATCQRDYGLKIKGATIYVRFERDDGSGQTVEPLQDGQEISRDFTFWETRPVKMPKAPPAPQPQSRPEPVDPISAREMIDLCQKEARRVLSGVEMKSLIFLEKSVHPERKDFLQALGSMRIERGRFDVRYLECAFMQ